MQIKLTHTDEELKRRFRELKTREGVADLLEVDHSTLIYFLYRKDRPHHYKEFKLRKRTGGTRTIHAPISSLKILQQKLNRILNLVYLPKASTHGFCISRSIKTNAEKHVGKRVVFNVDLMDFFPTINFGRVRGMLMARPYDLSEEVATMLAQIFCHPKEGFLPQGAPSSPIVSNMLCARLDDELQRLAQDNRCTYTRYADDITFSTTQKFLSPEIQNTIDDRIVCGERLKEIISSNGFKINRQKIRIKKQSQRQIVTGLIVNEFPNVKRSFVREVRSMLHAWEVYGLVDATSVFKERYCKKERGPHINEVNFRRVLKGKLDFIKMVRGQKDAIYRKYLNQYNHLSANGLPELPVTASERIKSSLWIVESSISEDVYQGTAFSMNTTKGQLLVTANHVVIGENVIIYKYNDPGTTYPVTPALRFKREDICLLDISTVIGSGDEGLEIATNPAVDYGDRVTVASFPDHWKGDEPHIVDTRVASRSVRFGLVHIVLDRPLIGGMSGAPVLNSMDEVVGVSVTGASDYEEAKKTSYYAVSSIQCVLDVVNEASK